MPQFLEAQFVRCQDVQKFPMASAREQVILLLFIHLSCSLILFSPSFVVKLLVCAVLAIIMLRRELKLMLRMSSHRSWFVFCFYLSHGLARLCEIELSHMGKNNGYPYLVCKNICYRPRICPANSRFMCVSNA